MGFTVSLLVASVAFTGVELKEATLGVLTAAVVAALLTWLVFQITDRLPSPLRSRALLGRSPAIVDLADPVDDDRDHIRGPADADVTLVEYGDFECPYCGRAEPVIRELLADFGDLRYVWRHLPLNDVHPRAQLAAEASEAAAAQGAFWPMHDLLIEHQDELAPKDLIRYAEQHRTRCEYIHRGPPKPPMERTCRGRRRERRRERGSREPRASLSTDSGRSERTTSRHSAVP